jgi:hypothetical protein
MDTRRLVFGLAMLLVIVGALLACFTPGGILNRGVVTQSVDLPFVGSLTVRAEGASSPWPIVGYVLLGLGGLGLVIAFAIKVPPKG